VDLREIGWGGVWSGFIWLRIGIAGGLLWIRWRIFAFWRHGVSYTAIEGSLGKLVTKLFVQQGPKVPAGCYISVTQFDLLMRYSCLYTLLLIAQCTWAHSFQVKTTFYDWFIQTFDRIIFTSVWRISSSWIQPGPVWNIFLSQNQYFVSLDASLLKLVK
jgi:hypothetical protein